MKEQKKEYCHICEKNGSYVRCKHCDEVFCEDCSAVYSEHNQIDYNCCKNCAIDIKEDFAMNRLWDESIKFRSELQLKYINQMEAKYREVKEPKVEYKTKAKTDFMERLIEEAEQLGERINKLYQFIGSEKFEKVVVIQQDLLIIQLSQMKGYLQVLKLRIKDLNRK